MHSSQSYFGLELPRHQTLGAPQALTSKGMYAKQD
jgi:hypothetical protein